MRPVARYPALVADLLSGARVLLAALVVAFALEGAGQAAGAALVAGGVTDAFDGRVARRRGGSPLGAHLDAVADVALLACTVAAVAILRPDVAGAAGPWLAATLLVLLPSLVLTWLASRRLVDPGRLAGKVAGGLLYLFAAVTLLSGAYSPVLLAAALGALAVASVEAIFRAVKTIHANGIASTARSQAPHMANGVTRSTAPSTSSASSSAAAISETLP